jgi:Resolvase, N terminal domain
VGRLLFTILAAVAEFERDLIVERTYAGLAAAGLRGHTGGRLKTYTDRDCRAPRQLRDAGEMTAPEIASLLGVSRATYFRMVATPAETLEVWTVASRDDELEPMTGKYDWAEAVRQNPEQGIEDLPPEAAAQLGAVLAEEVEAHLARRAGVDD